jgi:nucleoside-diphosphate-sugar epimerase
MIWAGKLLGKGDMVSRLVGSLSVDSLPIRTTLSWSPPYSLKSGLKKTVEWYLHQGVRQ